MALIKDSIVDDWLEDDKLLLMESWARDGLKMQDIAEKIGISRSTLSRWRSIYPEIDKALKTGKEIIDYKVENALLKSALGYTAREVKVTFGKQTKNGKIFEITKEVTTKDIPPNVTACLSWLNNRRPDKWKRNRDNFVEDDEDNSNLTISIVRGPAKDDINQEVVIKQKSKREKELESKTPKELYKMCKENGIDCPQKKTAEYYISLLKEFEENE